jgi:hypothetical protein
MITPKPNTVIHVKTQEEYNELMKELEESGFRERDINQWSSYKKNTVIFIDNHSDTSYANVKFCKENGYTIEEYRPEFRVGDTVEKINFRPGDTIVEGTRGVITRKSNDSDFDWQIKYEGFEEKELAGREKNLKLISRAEEPKSTFTTKIGPPIEFTREKYEKSLADLGELFKDGKEYLNKINKPNKKTFMSNIIANAFKSKEDKALEGLGLGTTKELNQSGREEYVNFLFETDGKGTKEEFFSKIVEAYNDTKK